MLLERELCATNKNAPIIDGIGVEYTNKVFPISNYKLLTVNYYDNYEFPFVPSSLPTTVLSQPVLTNVKGMTTGSWVRVLTDESNAIAETSVTFYDTKARPIRSLKNNYLGGYTNVDSSLDFSGKTLQTVTYHKRDGSSTVITTTEDFTYSNQDRLLTHYHRVNSLPQQLIAGNTYDELGKLISKNVGTSFYGNPLQKEDYSYNIRGWLTNINNVDDLSNEATENDLFGFKISYNQINGSLEEQISPLYNGNISETYWSTATDNIARKYSYAYDALNRMKKALYQKVGYVVPLTHSYDEMLDYDKNGNITGLQRNGDMDTDDVSLGTLMIDDLKYEYAPNSPNQLLKVTDGSNMPQGFSDDVDDVNDANDDYVYDANGNMTRDENKHIQNITYNHLNLPVLIRFFGSTNQISYIYNALGQKVQKTVKTNGDNATTDYLDGYQYVDTVLKFFQHAEGYVNVVNSDTYLFNYVFQYKDHLGNIRVNFGEDPLTHVLRILTENHYYPFGLQHTNYNSDKKMYIKEDEILKIKPIPLGKQPPYKYKYNGMEWQDEMGLNMYDYGARNYDPAIGRWMNIDPQSDNYYSISPYVSFANNPVFFIDPTGEDIVFWQVNVKTGEWEQVAFNKLDKSIKQGILDFGKTKDGYAFLANFANAGDKIGDLKTFEKDGEYSEHNFNFLEVEGGEFTDYEAASSIDVFKNYIDFNMKINKNMSNNTRINMAETIGHEAFLHFEQDIHELTSTFDIKGWKAAFALEQKQRDDNVKGYKDHLAVKDDIKGRAKKYFNYITQLKKVLNPNEVQKHVNKENEKVYKAGKNDAPKKKK